MWLENKDKTISPCPQLKLHKLYAFICHTKDTLKLLMGGGGGVHGVAFFRPEWGQLALRLVKCFPLLLKNVLDLTKCTDKGCEKWCQVSAFKAVQMKASID